MIVLYILGVLALLIFLLLMLNIKVHVKSDGELALRAGAGPVMIKLIPKKEKKIKLKDFSHKKYLRKMEALRLDKEKKAAKKRKKQEKPKKVKTKEEKRDVVTSIIELVIDILGRLDKYTSRINAKLDKLILSVGGKDPLDASVKFGVLSTSVSLLLELLNSKTKPSTKRAIKKSCLDLQTIQAKTLCPPLKVS